MTPQTISIPVQTPFHQKTVDYLFLRLACIYGYMWTSMHSEAAVWEAMKDTWAQALQFFSAEIIGKVLNDLVLFEMEYPPTLVKFIKMCRRYSGIPSEHETLKLALNNDFTLAITKEVYDVVGSFAMRNGTEKEVRAKWKEAYLTVVAKFYQKHATQKTIGNSVSPKTEETSFYRQPKGYEPTPTAARPDPKVEEWEAMQKKKREASSK